MRGTVAVAEEVVSPELVLVSPPEEAAQARAALPNYEVEFERWVVETRAAFAARSAAPRGRVARRFTSGALAFTAVAAVNCLTPLVVLILLRQR